MDTFINNWSSEQEMIALNFDRAGAGKNEGAKNGAIARLDELISSDSLLEEIRMYLLGNIYDQFGIGSGYYRMQQRFSMAENGAQRALDSIAKELFLFYAVLVLGFTITGIKKELKRKFTKEQLGQVTVDISSILRTEYLLFLNEDESEERQIVSTPK